MDGCYNCVRSFDGTVFILCDACHQKRIVVTVARAKAKLEETKQWLQEQ